MTTDTTGTIVEYNASDARGWIEVASGERIRFGLTALEHFDESCRRVRSATRRPRRWLLTELADFRHARSEADGDELDHATTRIRSSGSCRDL